MKAQLLRSPSMASSLAIDVLDFWFSDRVRALWFASDPGFDQEIRSRFGRVLSAAADGAFQAWTAHSEGALALVILFDQFTRNIHRAQARAFENDREARRIADGAIADQLDLALPLDRRMFLYLPFEHSESLADQQRSVELFSRWLGEHPRSDRAEAEEEMAYVLRHHEIVRRFGRFPHRNGVLGRISTPEELAFLRGPNSSF